MYRCLTRAELKQFIDYKSNDKEIDDEYLSAWIKNAENWQDEIGALTYLFSMVLMNEAKDDVDCAQLIDGLYALENEMSLTIQEIDVGFVEYMLMHLRERESPLEEELITLQNNLSEYKYGKALRY